MNREAAMPVEGAIEEIAPQRRFRPYGEYRESGIEGVRAVPAHWPDKPLKYVVTVNADKLADTTDPDYELEYVDIGNVSLIDGVTSTESYRFENAPSRARRRVQPGDTIVSTVRTYLKAVARIDDPAPNLVVSTGFAVLHAGPEIDPTYLYRFVHSDAFVERVVAHSVGVSYPAINPPDLVGLPIPVPPLDEQQAIAAFLDRETARIDELVAKKLRLIELLTEKRTALISQAVTKGLNPDAPIKDSGVEWFGLIPEHWVTLSLARLTSSRCDGPFGSGLKSSHYVDSGVRVVRLQNIGYARFIDSDAAFIDEEYYARELGDHDVHGGDVLIAGLGDEAHPVGRASVAPRVIEPAMVKADCFRFRLKRDRVVPQFAAYQLSDTARATELAFATGTTRLRMNLSNTLQRRLAIPPLSEQRAIAAFLDRETARIDELITKVREAIDKLREYRSALISAGVTGKIDVRGPGRRGAA